MKKFISLIIMLLAVFSLVACGGNTIPTEPDPTDPIITEPDPTDPGELVVDGELLQAIRDVKSALSREEVAETLSIQSPTNLSGGSGIHGLLLSTPRLELQNEIKLFQGDAEWLWIQSRYYSMLEEVVLNGYQQGNYENVKDFLDDPEIYFLTENQEFILVINLEEKILYSRVQTFSDILFTNMTHTETIYARLDENDKIYLERFIYTKNNRLTFEIFYQDKGLSHGNIFLNPIDHQFSFGNIFGLVLDENVSFVNSTSRMDSILNNYSLRLGFYNNTGDLYLNINIQDNSKIVNSVNIINQLTNTNDIILSENEIFSLLSGYNKLFGVDSTFSGTPTLTNGQSIRINTTRMDELSSIFFELNETVNRYNQSLNNFPYRAQQSDIDYLSAFEFRGQVFNLLDANQKFDSSLLGQYERLYSYFDLYNMKYSNHGSYLDHNDYKHYLAIYETATTDEEKAEALVQMYVLIYEMRASALNGIIDDILIVSNGETLLFEEVAISIDVQYTYYENIENHGGIPNNEVDIMNAAQQYYDYLKTNHTSLVFTLGQDLGYNFNIYNITYEDLYNYLISKAVPTED